MRSKVSGGLGAEGIQGLVHCSPCSKKGRFRVPGLGFRVQGLGILVSGEVLDNRAADRPLSPRERERGR